MNIIPDPGEWSLGVGCAISLCLAPLFSLWACVVRVPPPLHLSPGWIETNENTHDVGPFFSFGR
jgi:hypothetical protein